MIGNTLSHYKILDKLGEGGMGEVYLAEDTTLHRKVALKVLPAEIANSQERLDRFQREAESLAALSHPNIVTVFSIEATGLRSGRSSAEDDPVPEEAIEHQEIHFITMELVEGESLDRIITADGLPVAQLFDLAIPMADALSEAHEQGIVHRDLKPANVMVDGKGRPKILDFGLAKLRAAETAAGSSELPTEVMTEEGKVLGTYPYMSPEQVEGKQVDHRSDVFSLGTMLYEMATGHRPFRGDSSASVMSAILREEPPQVDLEREELPHHLSRIIGRCLEKDAGDRYQQANNLKKDLESLRQEVQTGVGAVSRPAATLLPTRRWRRPAVLGLAAFLAAAAIAFWAKPWERSEAPKPDPGPRITSLAVLPLENLSGDPEQDYYAAGITEGLIAELGQIAALRVISSRSVLRFEGSELPLPEIAQQLGVEALIDGSVLSAGERVRVTAQLIQADPEEQLWAETYERDARDIVTLLGEVTRAIATEVRVAVSPREEALLSQIRQVDPEAHRAYLRGQNAFRRATPADVVQAAELFREALEINPNYALAWTGLASYHLSLEIWALPYGAEELRRLSAIEADAALQKALELDESSSQAHGLRAWVEWLRNWDWVEAETEFRRALELNPNDSDIRIWHARFLSAMGPYEDASRENNLAEQLDPLSALVHRVWGDVHLFGRDYEASLRSYERALDLDPEHFYALGMMGFTLTAMGRLDEAWDVWMAYRKAMGQEALLKSLEGKTWEEAYRLVLEAMQDPTFVNSGPVMFAGMHADMGEYEEALDWLERGYATKEDPGKTAGWLFSYLKVSPNFDPLHSDPRFQDLLERMNLAD